MTIVRCCALAGLIWALDVSQAEAQCSYSLTPTSFTVGSTSANRTLSVITGTQCSWTATTTASWITITAGATGTGIGSVTFVVSENTSGGERTATLTVAGQIVTVTQGTGSCSGTVTPLSFEVGSLATSRTLSVIAGTQCPWTATTAATWITITAGASGSGIGSVTFSVAANTTGVARNATLSVAGQSVAVSQTASGGSQPPTPPSNLRIVR